MRLDYDLSGEMWAYWFCLNLRKSGKQSLHYNLCNHGEVPPIPYWLTWLIKCVLVIGCCHMTLWMVSGRDKWLTNWISTLSPSDFDNLQWFRDYETEELYLPVLFSFHIVYQYPYYWWYLDHLWAACDFIKKLHQYRNSLKSLFIQQTIRDYLPKINSTKLNPIILEYSLHLSIFLGY